MKKKTYEEYYKEGQKKAQRETQAKIMAKWLQPRPPTQQEIDNLRQQ